MKKAVYQHISVLKFEFATNSNLRPGDIAVDCTLGGGGHSTDFLRLVKPQGRVLAIDRDEVSIENAKANFAQEIAAQNLKLFHRSFSELEDILRTEQVRGKVACIGADVGVSSMHLDDDARGFSFMKDGPLDMRMDRRQKRTAKDIVNEESLENLQRIFRDYGEEVKAYHYAKSVVRVRDQQPFETTKQLADFIAQENPYRTASKKHPATRIFQALRIATNDELSELNQLLESGWQALRQGGRLMIISFHSLEDRCVKQFMVKKSTSYNQKHMPREVPLTHTQMVQGLEGKVIKPFPIVPSDEEVSKNVRSRSAKLRVLEKISAKGQEI